MSLGISGRPHGYLSFELLRVPLIIVVQKRDNFTARFRDRTHSRADLVYDRYAEEFTASRLLVDARVLSIFEGANEIQAHVIARRLIEKTER